jgi:hypothetical protein
MPDIQCGKFTLIVWANPEAKIGTWSAPLTPGPRKEWMKIFEEERVAGAGIGNYPGTKLRFQDFSDGRLVQFDSPDDPPTAAVDLIRRIIQKTNGRLAKIEAEEKQRSTAQTQRASEAQAELKRRQEKYKDGI